MSNLEVLENGIRFTYQNYIDSYMGESYETVNKTQLTNAALKYSSDVVYYMLTEEPSVWDIAYTRKNGLRDSVLSLSVLDIENELLKNAVKVASYNRINDTNSSNYLGFNVNDNMTDDSICVVLSNIIRYQDEGVNDVYALLENNPNVLKSLCRSFVTYRTDMKKSNILDDVVSTDKNNNVLLNYLDVDYARKTSGNNYRM